jgi:clathrin heavy chain
LLGLLEKLVLHNPKFGQYKKLQNLLIVTTIKSGDVSKVIDFVMRLDNFDGPEIASFALSDEYRLYEVAFTIYNKFSLNVEAVDVLLNQLENIARA